MHILAGSGSLEISWRSLNIWRPGKHRRFGDCLEANKYFTVWRAKKVWWLLESHKYLSAWLAEEVNNCLKVNKYITVWLAEEVWWLPWSQYIYHSLASRGIFVIAFKPFNISQQSVQRRFGDCLEAFVISQSLESVWSLVFAWNPL